MADPRFFKNAGPFALGDIARRIDAEPSVSGQEGRLISDVRSLELAEAEHLSFIDNKKYGEIFAASKAGFCIAHPKMAARAPAGMVLLLTEDPYRAWAKAEALFYPAIKGAVGIASGAFVHEKAKIGQDVQIAHGAVIEEDAEIGDGCSIGANAVIGAGVVIGAHSRIGANATISHCLMGQNCRIYPGVCIGQDGFGFAMSAKGHLKVPQLGRVVIEDDVEIGANTTIDRGAGPDTVIGRGSKIDNLVQIGHNVTLGQGCIIVSQVGISGSCHIGDFAVLGGQVGLAGHLTIGTGAQIAAQSGVMRDVPPGAKMGGTPATTVTEWMKRTATIDRLARKKGKTEKDS